MKPKTKIGALALAACLAFTAAMPVFAAENKIAVTFTDVTSTANTLKGEAKIKISVKGADGKATIAQMALDFDGDLKYKSTQFLKGANDPENGSFWTAKAGKDNKLMTSIVSNGGIDFSDDEELFIITFEGKAGEKVTLNLADLENTYCTVDGKDRNAGSTQTIELTASSKSKEGKTAKISLVMDKLSNFSTKDHSQITVKITNEKTKGDVITTTINPAMQSDGGHRSGKQNTPTFVVENTVIADDTYTVEISGIGYVTYKQTGVKFGDALKITNSDFIPGDVDNDGNVDADDKAMVEKLIADKDYSIAADFNRDNTIDDDDLAVFADIKDKTDNTTDNNTQGGNNGNGGTGGGSAGGSSNGGGFSGGTTVTPSNNEAFTDLANHAWAKESIYTLKNKGVISGISDTEFAPANNIKRGDFMLILTRMLGISDAFTENFADVPMGAYYHNAVGSAKAAGIASGDGENFMPENTITRQDLITLAYRAFLNKGYITETDDLSVLDIFSDKDDISDYARSAMASMVKAGIIQGSDGKVNPKGFATRAEVAVMCARMLNLMK